MLLTGTYQRALDEKLRIALPKPLRDLLGKLNQGIVYLTPETDGSLALYAEETLVKLAARLEGASSPVNQEVRAFLRLFYAQAQPAEMDAQGRIRLTSELVRHAQLEKEVMLIGVRDHLEIWGKKAWERYLAEKTSQYDQIAESAYRGSSPGA